MIGIIEIHLLGVLGRLKRMPKCVMNSGIYLIGILGRSNRTPRYVMNSGDYVLGLGVAK